MYMDKRDDYKQTIMNMETVLAKLLTLDHSMSEQQLDMQIPQLLEQIGEYTQSDRVYFSIGHLRTAGFIETHMSGAKRECIPAGTDAENLCADDTVLAKTI